MGARFIALPFAGGSAWSYRPLASHLEPIIALDYPGHGRRMSEPLRASIGGLADAVVESARAASWSREPYILFGHSLGAHVAAHAAAALEGATPLQGVVVSGTPPTWALARERSIHTLPDPEFLAEVRKLGHDSEALTRPEVRDLVTPILRADYRAVETAPPERPAPIAVPVLGLRGLADRECEPEAFAAWSALTRGPFEEAAYPGDHFFLFAEAQSMVLETLTRFRGALASPA